MTLDGLLAEQRDRILTEALSALGHRHLSHYETAGSEVLRERLARLLDLTVTAVADRNLTGLLAYAESVGRERFDAGFDLLEVQAAFNVLEEALWRALVAALPPAELAEGLGLVGTALGAGKDRLAATWVELASRTHTPTLDLQALFAGTESAG
jgi:hypothetical protein